MQKTSQRLCIGNGDDHLMTFSTDIDRSSLLKTNTSTDNDNIVFDEYPHLIDNAIRKLKTQCSSPANLLQTGLSFFPFFTWLPQYSFRNDFLPDMLAGLTVGIIHVPMGISYALMSHVSPINGLYASFFATFFYFFFGTSHQMSLGPIALIALITGALTDSLLENTINAPDPEIIASTLNFTIGLVVLVIAVLKLEFIATYFSDALVGGFTTAAAIHILSTQIPLIFGIRADGEGGFGNLAKRITMFVNNLPMTNFATLTLGTVSLLILRICKHVIHPALIRHCCFRVFVPYELILITITTILSAVFEWNSTYNIPIVGYINPKLPVPTLPDFSLIPDCLGSAVGITIIALGLHISIAKMAAKRCNYEIDCGQEVYAMGFTALFSGFFPTIPGAPALARTNIAIENNQRTLLGGVPTCILLLFVIIVLGPYLSTMPLCVLAAVITNALMFMMENFLDLGHLWVTSKYDFLIWTVAFTITLVADVVEGLVASLVFILLTVIIRTQSPCWTGEFHFNNAMQCVIFKFKGFLLFSNVDIFHVAVNQILNKYEQQIGVEILNLAKTDFDNRVILRKFIFDFDAVIEVDSAGYKAIAEACATIDRRMKLSCGFVNLKPEIQQQIVKNVTFSIDPEFYNATKFFH